MLRAIWRHGTICLFSLTMTVIVMGNTSGGWRSNFRALFAFAPGKAKPSLPALWIM
jgi:hypothetical protein